MLNTLCQGCSVDFLYNFDSELRTIISVAVMSLLLLSMIGGQYAPSIIIDWWFLLSNYQLTNLACPIFYTNCSASNITLLVSFLVDSFSVRILLGSLVGQFGFVTVIDWWVSWIGNQPSMLIIYYMWYLFTTNNSSFYTFFCCSN